MSTGVEREHEGGGAIVTLARVATPFEAHALVAILDDEEIESWVAEREISGPSIPAPARESVTINVRSSDLVRARAAIEGRKSDSIDIDWDSIDVGERDDQLPLTTVGRVPPLAQIALAALVALLAIVLVTALVALFV
jgi:hypothetical protein